MSFISVFSTDELIKFYDPYFRQCAWESNYLELQSKNTGHYWLLIKDPSADVPVTLLHKHQLRQPYHKQCVVGCVSIDSAIKKIKKHDAYIIKQNTK